MEYWKQIRTANGIIGTLITYHDNGTLQVRINRGQQWAWQIISVSEDDAEFLDVPTEDPEEEEEVEHEAPINNQSETMSNKTLIIGVIALVMIFLAVGYLNTIKKPSGELETMTAELNQMNVDDIRDIGSCKALKQRKIEKKKILDKIKGME